MLHRFHSARDSHYPSWGLETAQVRPLRVVLADLITPHGDWKPTPPCRRPRSRRAHYPSWGLETLADEADAQRHVISLPLMGIGNWPGMASQSDQSRPHYPSWGLETHVRAGDLLPNHRLITPHGDWKRARMRHESHSLDVLITPHGDWKLPCSANSASGRGNSLPLMGIGNVCLFARRLRSRHLITPHGDWKPGADPDAAADGCAHYPSWGLETRSGSTAAPACRRAHYPSWGLETEFRHGHNAGKCSSLPLMGIGNPSIQSISRIEMYGTSQNKQPWSLNLRLSTKPEMVLWSSAQTARQRIDQFLPCHVSSS